MTILSAHDGITIATKPLDFNAAQRFALCIQGNAQYFDVEVRPHPRVKGKYQAHYHVTDPARAARLLAKQQASREDRAEAQADSYHLRSVVNGGFEVTEVINLLSGAVYSVQPNGSCDCPDAKHRTAGNCLCKHGILALNFQLAEREAAHLTSLSQPVPAHIAAIRARINEDFPDAA